MQRTNLRLFLQTFLVFTLLLIASQNLISEDKTEDKIENNDSLNLFLSQEEFFFADNPRYTMIGHRPYRENDIQPLPAVAFGSVFAGILATQHIYQVKTIWTEKSKFKIMEDGDYALYSDKLGHVYGSYITAQIFREGLYASGFNNDWATITGGILGLGYETYVEIMDGYGENWGFSPSDYYADVAGAVWFIAQEYVPFLQNFTIKYMYIPADWHGEKRRQGSAMLIDDYSSQTYWMSINVHNILPEPAKDYWPNWLELSVGYAARNLCHNNCDPLYSPYVIENVYGRRKIIIALDYDMVALLPDGCNTWNVIKQYLNYFKFPSPAVEFDLEGGATRFMLLYPF